MDSLQGREGHARIVVATVIKEELDAAKRILATRTRVTQGYWGATTGTRQDVLVTRIDRANTPAALSVRDLLEAWRPEIVILCGIAGGVGTWVGEGSSRVWRGPALGDVVVGQFVHYADYAKNSGNARKMRYFPLDHPPSRLVENLRDDLQDRNDWAASMKVRHPHRKQSTPAILDGEFLATESVAGSPRWEAQRHMLRFFDNARAVDMESAGVARSIHQYRTTAHYNPRWISIRGISDHVWAAPDDGSLDDWDESGNQSQREKFREYAAAAAAAVTKAVITLLNEYDEPLSDPTESLVR